MNSKRKVGDRSPQTIDEPALRKMRTEMEVSFDLGIKLTDAMEDFKMKVSTTLTAMELDSNPSNVDLKKWMMTLAMTQINGMDSLANIVSEVMTDMAGLDKDLKGKDKDVKDLKEELAAQVTVVKSVVVTRDKIEVKASSKDMEEKLKVSITQFKVMDLDMRSETDNRQEIVKRGMDSIRNKVRSDLQEEWMNLAQGVDVSPLVKKTAKPTGKDYYTAPLLFTVQDRTRRWRMEEILRSSRIFPGFHWPQEMMPIIKDYKNVLKDNGVNEDSTYVRIRPMERDGKVRLRADIKGKEGSGRFANKASWEAPPLCPEVRKKAKDYLKPVWAPTRG